jgi:hypothetical protein
VGFEQKTHGTDEISSEQQFLLFVPRYCYVPIECRSKLRREIGYILFFFFSNDFKFPEYLFASSRRQPTDVLFSAKRKTQTCAHIPYQEATELLKQKRIPKSDVALEYKK